MWASWWRPCTRTNCALFNNAEPRHVRFGSNADSGSRAGMSANDPYRTCDGKIFSNATMFGLFAPQRATWGSDPLGAETYSPWRIPPHRKRNKDEGCKQEEKIPPVKRMVPTFHPRCGLFSVLSSIDVACQDPLRDPSDHVRRAVLPLMIYPRYHRAGPGQRLAPRSSRLRRSSSGA